MSLRTKLALALAFLAALATLAVGAISYRATADQLHAEIDRSLEDTSEELATRVTRSPRGVGELEGRRGRREPPLGALEQLDLVVVQVVSPAGIVLASSSTELPVDDVDLALATAGEAGVQVWRTVDIDGEPHRLVTTSLGPDAGAVQAARSLEETERLLASTRNRIAVAALCTIVAAAALGWLIAWQVTRRLERVTRTAEEVSRTGRLDTTVPVEGRDEAGRLATSFNDMLGALARSKEDQQRLVQDAGHELRTPLTSLRTNISVLRRHGDLDTTTRDGVLDDLDSEARELTALVNELVALATDRRTDEATRPVELVELAERVAARARRRTGRVVTVDADGSVVEGRAGALERAITNLVDNATKFDESDAPIEVVVAGGRVEVRDRGPGIDDAELPHVFDRFRRAVAARSRPGSGLGLAIVRQTAEDHGGTAFAENRPGGGAVVGFTVGEARLQPGSHLSPAPV